MCKRALPFVALVLVSGCPNAVQPHDGGVIADAEVPADAPGLDASEEDAGERDASVVDAAMLDAGMLDAGSTDGGTSTGTMPTPPATIARMGSGAILLRGVVLTPSGPIADGEVLVVGDSIDCVADDCSMRPMAASATIVETNGVISPGLIDGHNHATYDFLPEWVPDPLRLFGSRYDWRADADYRAHVSPEADSAAACPGVKWAELRSIIHGTTTIMGQSPIRTCMNRLARNADHYHGLGADRMQTTIFGPCEASFDDDFRAGVIANFVDGDTTRFMVHMAEGVSGTGETTNVLREYECYGGDLRFTRDMLASPMGVPYGTSVFIHAVTLDEAQLLEAQAMDVRFVWSPSSNIVLYGDTAPIARMVELDLTVGMGPDWTVSGEDEMLSELRFARRYAEAEGIASLTPRRLWEMATVDGADVVDLAASIGTLEAGRRADIAVFGRSGADAYECVLDSRAEDVRLVMIDGRVYYGDLALEPLAVNGSCDDLDACGTAKFLCLADTPGATGGTSGSGEHLDDVRAQLVSVLGARSSELLELVDCAAD